MLKTTTFFNDRDSAMRELKKFVSQGMGENPGSFDLDGAFDVLFFEDDDPRNPMYTCFTLCPPAFATVEEVVEEHRLVD